MLSLLKLLPIGAQVAIGLAVIAAIGGGYYAFRESIFNKGVAYQRDKQNEVDNDAVRRAREGAHDANACNDAGGVWSQSSGVCDER